MCRDRAIRSGGRLRRLTSSIRWALAAAGALAATGCSTTDLPDSGLAEQLRPVVQARMVELDLRVRQQVADHTGRFRAAEHAFNEERFAIEQDLRRTLRGDARPASRPAAAGSRTELLRQSEALSNALSAVDAASERLLAALALAESASGDPGTADEVHAAHGDLEKAWADVVAVVRALAQLEERGDLRGGLAVPSQVERLVELLRSMMKAAIDCELELASREHRLTLSSVKLVARLEAEHQGAVEAVLEGASEARAACFMGAAKAAGREHFEVVSEAVEALAAGAHGVR